MKVRRVFRVAAAGRMVRLLAHDEAGEPIAEFGIVAKHYRPEMAERLLWVIDGNVGEEPTLPRGYASAFRRAFRGFLRLE